MSNGVEKRVRNDETVCPDQSSAKPICDAEFPMDVRMDTAVFTDIQRIEKLLDVCKSILIAKNANYGNSVLEKPLLAPRVSIVDAILVRLSDKFKRVAQLRCGEPDRVGESILDTSRDIINYSVFLCIAIQDETNARR